ncbi:MAG: hypothetical protein CMM01_26205 [Rhodopirellula sp.]|nr:hypothetical protein [Rhodopirellula sp.]
MNSIEIPRSLTTTSSRVGWHLMKNKQLKLIFVLAILTTVVATSPTSSAASPTGKWRGSWNSGATGHSGPLKARVRQVDHDTYRALFVGRFAGIIPFAYPARLDRVSGTENQYTSSQRLPLLGTYRMNATVTNSHIRAKFQGGRDSGTFNLSR